MSIEDEAHKLDAIAERLEALSRQFASQMNAWLSETDAALLEILGYGLRYAGFGGLLGAARGRTEELCEALRESAAATSRAAAYHGRRNSGNGESSASAGRSVPDTPSSAPGSGSTSSEPGGNQNGDAPEAAPTNTGPATFGSSTSTNYRKTFFDEHPGLKGQVWVHHAVERQSADIYPNAGLTDAEIHSLQNLRGIPKGETNNTVHLSKLRKAWNRFYDENPNATKQDLLDFATKMDDKYGDQFKPRVR
ncbi:hypothetical protein JOD54_000805 [Actinokineospora baliensis]|uniref:hypothetical protein n=1 Tax=Actinokineospora baliensis TaxID=547056 RepID=UPI0019582318|nr:hypothetical protein [Actinokineospora baliensis]MBM7770601.1 hypothetical protein [Actinokineospora baliensis]